MQYKMLLFKDIYFIPESSSAQIIVIRPVKKVHDHKLCILHKIQAEKIIKTDCKR